MFHHQKQNQSAAGMAGAMPSSLGSNSVKNGEAAPCFPEPGMLNFNSSQNKVQSLKGTYRLINVPFFRM
jgi:hypothetical protein